MDLHNNIQALTVIYPRAAGVAAVGQVGKIIDRRGYGMVEFILSYGTISATGTTCIPVVKEGDATGTMTSVADTDLLGTEANAALGVGAQVSGTNKNVVKRIGYKGIKRYVQVNLVPSVSDALTVAASAILG